MYFGAEHLIGFFTVWPSAQWYSYLGPADIMGHRSSVQNSVMVPYNILIWLKKSTVLTAIHSSISSPSGSCTASLKFPIIYDQLKFETINDLINSEGFFAKTALKQVLNIFTIESIFLKSMSSWALLIVILANYVMDKKLM